MSKSMVLKNPLKWTVTFLMVMAMQSFTFAEGDNDKVGSVAFKFLNIQTDARGAALGGLSAQASGAGALFFQPSGYCWN
jgi:predicted MFS family arabinose efflux permease